MALALMCVHSVQYAGPCAVWLQSNRLGGTVVYHVQAGQLPPDEGSGIDKAPAGKRDGHPGGGEKRHGVAATPDSSGRRPVVKNRW